MATFRIDPSDGQAYTFAKVQRLSQGQYTPEEIATYWAEMSPVNGTKVPRGADVAFSIKLSVLFNKQTSEAMEQLKFDIPWKDILVDFEFRSTTATMRLAQLATWLESIIEGNYAEAANDEDSLQVQIISIRSDVDPETELNFKDQVSQHFAPGRTVLIAAYLQAESSAQQQQPQWSKKQIEDVRATLRFGLNDRVICNCGRWLAGHIVGTAVPSDGELLPYLVKTDKLPGLPSRTISVPYDKNDDVCMQEVCFDPHNQLWLIQAAAALVPEASRPKLRYTVGDKVCCRVRNSPNDDLEQWVPGEVDTLWPKIPGDLEKTWEMGPVSGKFAEVVPYLVVDKASGRQIYCHKDDHTLIRRAGLQPLTRVRGISKRIEVVEDKDGAKVMLDHVTERRRPYCSANDFSDSD